MKTKGDAKIYVGIDAGSISVNVAVVGEQSHTPLFSRLCSKGKFFSGFENDKNDSPAPKWIAVSHYQRTAGEPIKVTTEILNELSKHIPQNEIGGFRITGAGGRTIGKRLNLPYENEFCAVAKGVGHLYPQVRTILEMGGDNSKYLKIAVDSDSETVRILDYEKNGDCAAGTGAFLDQQASRLLYDIEKVGDIVMTADRAATIAGRCSVFAKSDMIHAQQKGFHPPEVLKGLCEAMVRNFKSTITKGKEILPQVAFLGGVAANKGVVAAMRQLFDLREDEFFIPYYHAWMGAIGAALLASDTENNSGSLSQPRTSIHIQQNESIPTTKPLSLRNVTFLRDMGEPNYVSQNQRKPNTYLGLDIGSVSTNLALIDDQGNVMKEIYTKTDARPIEVVKRCLKEVEIEFGNRVSVLGVGTTGSGRELIGELIGADAIHDEITAHMTGAMHVCDQLMDKKVDTIFDIGGQDSKFISIDRGIVVDFTMNEACAAGTGSFLEEQSERLGINIKDQFSEMALTSKRPLRLGERCTVFMEQDVKSCMQKNAAKEDILAGLAYSVVFNYLNRVVRERKIGDVIFFQGGTAYNPSVAAAFSTHLNKQIYIPPHNGVIGAIGAALLAKEKITHSSQKSTFRGFDLDAVQYTIKNFTCKACPNSCEVSEFNVAGEKTYWGDKCAERYRSKAKSDKTPVIEDLIKLREQLLPEYLTENNGPEIGLPRSLYFRDRLPFWTTFFSDLGFRVTLSSETNKQIVNWGLDSMISEPCFPVAVAHGHIRDLVEKKVDYIFQPNTIDAETEFPEVQSFLCPWGQTLPFLLANNPAFKHLKESILKPTIHFRDGIKIVKKELDESMAQFDIPKKRIHTAIENAYEAQQKFEKKLQQAGQIALKKLVENNELGIVLLGRAYNIYDKSVSLNIPVKLRKFYGINIIPMDFLSLHSLKISDINDNMFWNYGRRIIQAAKFVGQIPNLHIIYITNFKCGPDSYIKHYIEKASKKPFLTLQFDAHNNDAGIMTRCEAYLDSKGFLRWWKK